MKQLLTNFIGTFCQIEKAIGSGEEREGKRRKREGKKRRGKKEINWFFFPNDFGTKRRVVGDISNCWREKAQ